MHFTKFGVREDHNTLILLNESDETPDLMSTSLTHEIYYKVNVDKDYDVIKLFNNGKETSFSTISGNNQQ